ncbi:hypothetical protein CHO01_27410 [Cellulomonas hominis]|uniref:Helix-turn-helix domain-containing protein n=1 Tax=Cellulomonas hominis TaxID=156981 RepID=A0A511FEG1_9CELL|nr:hypothetical protein CHO01_27410 [Cellulomonas hominis]
MRVHELAWALGISSRDLVARLRAEGEWVSSHLSSVPAPVVRRYRPQAALADRARDVTAPPTAPATRVVATEPTARAAPTEWRRGPHRRGPRPQTLREYRRYGDEYDDIYDTLRYQDRLTTRDVADLLGVTAATVRQWVRRGYLAPVAKQGPSHVFAAVDVRRAHQLISERHRGTGIPSPDPWHARTLRPIDQVPGRYHDNLVTTPDAAVLADVSPATIRSWIHRGHLTPIRIEGNSRVLLRVGDLMRVARERRLPRRRPQAWVRTPT